MTKISVKDYFPHDYPVYVNPIEIENGESIPTYFLMQQLEARYPQNDFYFIIGSDLLPGLAKWDGGDNFVNECGFVLFERKGHEDKMDPDGEQKFTMPPKIEVIAKEKSIVGEISSTEIRNRIKAAKQLQREKQFGEEQQQQEEPAEGSKDEPAIDEEKFA